MTIGAAIVLIAVGAVLKWAVTAHVSGFDIQTAGTVVFVVGLVVSLKLEKQQVGALAEYLSGLLADLPTAAQHKPRADDD